MLTEESFAAQPETGLEESTRPFTRPVEPRRPRDRADHIWLASDDGMTQIGTNSPNPGWKRELTKLADLLGPHLREGAESTFEMRDGYSVVCVATPMGWLMAVGIQGQDVRELRRDALVMARRTAAASTTASIDSEDSTAPTFAELAPQLRTRVAIPNEQIAVARRLWGTIGPLYLTDDGQFELMAHIDPEEPLTDFEQQWTSWSHRMRLATGFVLPTFSDLLGSTLELVK